MKKALAIVLTLVLIVSILPIGFLTVSATTSGTTGDCTWSLSNGTLTISGNGKMGYCEFGNNGKPWGKDITKVVFDGVITNIGDWAFSDCYRLKEIVIPEGVTTIGIGAFSNCARLKSVVLPNSLITIEDAVFGYCQSLESLYIPDKVESIGKEYLSEVFYECKSLKAIYVSSVNQYYTSVDGVLFNKDKSKIITYPAAKGTAYIIPEGVETIKYSAFLNCSNLEKIVIPSSVKEIEGATFSTCENLYEVIYGGTAEDKKQIKIGQLNEKLLLADWYYSYEDLSTKTCYICNNVAENLNGEHIIYDEFDDLLYYYNNGEKVNVDGLHKIDGTWYYFEDGIWDLCKKTMCKLNGKWFYIQDGIWKSQTALVKYKGKTFYISGGKWDSSVNALKKVGGSWYLIKNGKWDDSIINSLYKLDGKWYLIQGGKWYKSTGVVEFKGKDFYVKDGVWSSSVNTLHKGGKRYFAIKNGKWTKSKVIIKYKGKKYYCYKGYAKTDYSGKVTINGKKYTVKKGIIK